MGNIVDPTAIVGPNVSLGDNNWIGPYCVLTGRTEIGDNNVFTSHVSVGAPPQHRKFMFDPNKLSEVGPVIIGSNNTFREFVTIHAPYITKTDVGSDCYIMAYAHISHDTTIEDGVTIANSAQIGGHCVVMKYSNLGLSVVLHQFTVVGSYAMLGMGSASSRNLLPFNKYVGVPPRRIGLNKIGLERHSFDSDALKMLEHWSSCYLTSSEHIDLPEQLVSEVQRFEHYVSKQSEE